jgi:hypothetical protein
MTRKSTAQWIARKKKGWPLRKGKLVVGGNVIADGVTLDQATRRFPNTEFSVGAGSAIRSTTGFPAAMALGQ